MSLFQLLSQVVWWFHPLVWWANARICREREHCCDEEVVAALDCDPGGYAQTLLDVLKLRRQLQPALLPGVGASEVTQERLERIMQRGTKHLHMPPLGWAIVIVGVLLVAPGAGLAPSDQGTAPGDAGTEPAGAAKPPAAENLLSNPGMEDGDASPAGWEEGANVEGVTYIWDRRTGFKSNSSLCFHKTANRFFPVAQWSQALDTKGDVSALDISAQVKAEEAAKAIVDVIFYDAKGDWIKHQWACYIGQKDASGGPANHDWRPYSGRVDVPLATDKIVVALQIYGPGRVWFDDVRVVPAAGAAPAAAAPTGSVPQIAATSPAVRAVDVDPAVAEITVTFDRDMAPGCTWNGDRPDYPFAPNSNPFWRDRRTCVLPVKLEPGRSYRIGLNRFTPNHQAFASAEGVRAPATTIHFATRGARRPDEAADTRPAPPPVQPDAKVVVEGVGWEGFRIGATREELIGVCGDPDPNPNPGNPWMRWRSRYHVDCMLDKNGRAVEVRFNEGFPLPLTSGVRIGSSEQQALSAYGVPDRVVQQLQAKMFVYDRHGVIVWVMRDKVMDFTVTKKREGRQP